MGTAERDAALLMLERLAGDQRVTVGADRGYDTRDFVQELRGMHVAPHVAQNTNGRCSAIDKRTTWHAGYAASQRKRKRIEEVFGWLKTVAGIRKVRHRGLGKVTWMSTFAAAAYNLVRMRNLRVQAASTQGEVCPNPEKGVFFSTGELRPGSLTLLVSSKTRLR